MKEYTSTTSSFHVPAGEVPAITMDIYGTHIVLSASVAGARVVWFLTPGESQSLGDLVTSVTGSLSTITVETIND